MDGEFPSVLLIDYRKSDPSSDPSWYSVHAGSVFGVSVKVRQQVAETNRR